MGRQPGPAVAASEDWARSRQKTLFRYGLGASPSIHIIVENGQATLKGVVATEADKQLAYPRARSVSGLFQVTNDSTFAVVRA
jgi:osmotically-inducible protein OsmY